MSLKEKKKNMVMLVGIKLKLKYERNICNKINEVKMNEVKMKSK